ncbi:MAG: hypothetical protein IKG56_04170 [Clostridia bacterium]|nr:hypothetical protein [Clostridia bacterium]
MRKIYFILTDTGTILSNIVKIFMRDEFGHVSLSLDKNLRQMYSFGRLKPYNAFIGGFVHENIKKGTFRRFSKTKALVLSYEIENEQYKSLKENIFELKKKRRQLSFNILGLFGIYFKIKRRKDDYFYCAEFIKYVTEKSGIDLKLPELVRPENFKHIEGCKIVYKGLLKDYKIKDNKINKE